LIFEIYKLPNHLKKNYGYPSFRLIGMKKFLLLVLLGISLYAQQGSQGGGNPSTGYPGTGQGTPGSGIGTPGSGIGYPGTGQGHPGGGHGNPGTGQGYPSPGSDSRGKGKR